MAHWKGKTAGQSLPKETPKPPVTSQTTTKTDLIETFDLLILVDATYSMSSYLESLQTSLPKIISISALTDSFSRIGLLAYRDYCDPELLEWSGWMSQTQGGLVTTGEEEVDLLATARTLEPIGGGDYPEATKTGLAKAYEVMREDATTVILLYTDAPPHTTVNGFNNGYDNHEKEQKSLGDKDSYGGFGPAFTDWVHAGRTLALKEEGKKRGQVFCMLEPSMQRSDGNYYTFLSTLTGGACLYLKNSSPKDIAKVTVDLLLAWMGVEKSGAAVVEIAARLSKFKSSAGIENVKKEATKASKAEGHTEELTVDSAVLKQFIPKRKTPVTDFAQRYISDPSYKKLVVEHLQKIIQQDVSSISLNPVFGSLWRAVCNDRSNEKREDLVTSFSVQVDKIGNTDEKQRMKDWLEESYDYGAEIQEAINSVPEAQRFPCVYLDPTLAFTQPDRNEDDEDNRAITDFRRDELLEIGRSCDYRILRRLGRVLTRLTFVNTPEELPAHIKAAKDEVTLIPMALASKDFERKFWRVLLHIVVPGTMLSARPAALLAALTIRLGIWPLFEAADKEMLLWRERWNNLDVPENWNISCLSLLLDADKAYMDRKKSGKSETESSKIKGSLLDSDRKLFHCLVAYMMLEMNLRTTLLAKVSWTPEKTTMPIGPVITCKACLYPRSITIMGPKSKCGNCLATDYKTVEEKQTRINTRVTKEDNETSNATWVECSTRTCRAQYVVYNQEALNVRPKCYYCRQQTSLAVEKRKPDPAPCVECTTCLSRVIIPFEYRHGDISQYKCIACTSDRQTVVEVETNPLAISKENTTAWLLENKSNKIEAPLVRQSLFKMIKQAGTDDFCEKVVLFPEVKNQKLALNGKLIQNAPDVIAQLKSWVYGRKTESETCSLCFSDFKKTELNAACGRKGCEQRICIECLKSWYGLNAAGRIVNVAAVSCPFCRRAPTAKTLHSYGLGIHAVANIRDAVEKSGTWIYAWCIDCSTAKPYLERVCAAGAPRELTDWRCEACSQIREETVVRAAQEQAEAEIRRLEAEARRLNYEQRMEAEREIRAARLKRKGIVLKELDIRRCPRCAASTEKIAGCGHMTCICGCHWCWFCCEKQQVNHIYEHMMKKHGTWFDPGEEGVVVARG
ncbi:hypothetical protein G7Y89_g10482 [Cudoniella acicularis]|uniref:RING-type domain-containing protein n=1 Tax=Cudoniella acicularis TaxID=354080 RepID=A0A8H4VZ00_9HELO|nr:hypothetical protein G7Y89_g10482 [Cudoniella acicularis]